MRLPPPALARRGPRSGRDWQGPQMAAAPPRGWSRGGGRAPSRGSRPGALGVRASPLEGPTGEARRSWPRAGARRPGPGRGGAQETRGESAQPDAARRRVAAEWEPGGEGVHRGDSGSCPRRPGDARRGPRRSPRTPLRPEEAKNAAPEWGVGHLATRASTAGKRWGGPWL